jgi:ParB-like chromosome segregation protein Spo0J
MPPKFTIKEIPISQIDNNFGQIEGVPENPRTITTEDFQNLKKSLDDDPGFLWLREPLVYPLKGRYVAIAGNQRIRALKELPVEFTPAKILDKNTPIDDLIRWAIKDNTSKGEWDWDALANEWDAEQLEDWGVDVDKQWTTEVIQAEPQNKEINMDELEQGMQHVCPRCKFQF